MSTSQVVPACGRHRAAGPRSSLRERLLQDRLLANSVYLMANTGLMAVLGFVFWLVCARTFTPTQIGEGTALISAAGLIGLTSMLGLNGTLIRYLPTSKERDSLVSTAIAMVTVASLAFSAAYVVVLPIVAPHLAFIRRDWWYASAFVVLTVASALNSLTDSVFVSMRSAFYNLFIDGLVQSSSKIALAVVLVSLGAFGIFGAFGGAALVAVVLSLVLMRLKFGFRPAKFISRAYALSLLRFAFGNYMAYLLNILPVLLIPVILVDRLNAADAGYYYLAFMIANVGFTAAYSVSTSLFAEAAHDREAVGRLLRRGLLILGGLVIPTSAILLLFGRLVLSAFGHNYEQHGRATLTILALSGPLVGAYDLSTVLLRIEAKVGQYAIVNAVYASTIVGLAYMWAPRGIGKVAVAWMLGNVLAMVVSVLFIVRNIRRPSDPVHSARRSVNPDY